MHTNPQRTNHIALHFLPLRKMVQDGEGTINHVSVTEMMGLRDKTVSAKSRTLRDETTTGNLV